MGLPAVQQRRWTAAEVRQLIEDSPEYGPRHELIDGALKCSRPPLRTAIAAGGCASGNCNGNADLASRQVA